MKNRILKAVCLVMALLMVFTGCSKKGKPAETTATTIPTTAVEQTYTVEVASEGGKALANVELRVYTDSTLSDLQWAGSTDANGLFSFTAPASSSYHVVLKNLPAGYETAQSYLLSGETTRLALKTKLLADVDLSKHKVNLGDVMFDFTVTDCEGTAFTLSQLLAEKEAVILNLWYEGCVPCQQEFPHFQQVYESYSDRIALLALNPMDGDDASISAYKAANGLSFPMVKVGAEWQKLFGEISYPTTVVIDRFGTVSLIHTGTVTDVSMLETLFAYYVAEDYKQHTVGSLDDLKQQDAPQGTEENPLEFGGVTMFSVTVPAGETVYCDVYKVSGMLFSIVDDEVEVTYNGKTYKPIDTGTMFDIVSFVVTSPDTYTPVKLAITNTGSEEKTYGVSFNFLPGTMGNPHTLEMGEFALKFAAGNDQGVYYLYKATEAGVITVECLEVTQGVGYGVTLYNLNTYAQHGLDAQSGKNLVSIDVNPGDEVQVIVSTLPDADNNYPAADFRLKASFEKKEISSCDHAATEVRNASAATCTADGYSGDTYCKTCGEKISAGTVIAATGHTDSDKNNACDTCGATTGTCSHSKTETKNQKDATCVTDGYSGDEYCKTCGERVKTGAVVSAAGHKTQLRNEKAATCTAEGYSGDTYCTVCKETVETGTKVSKLPHNDSNGDNKCDACGATTGTCSHSKTEVKNKKDATCTTTGYTGDTYCKTCGELVKNGSAIAATGHGKTEIKNQKAATCTADGYTGDTYCTVCKEKIASGAKITAPGHTEQTKNQKAATCTADGYTGDTYCSVCDKKLATGETIAASGHKDSDSDSKCDNCGASVVMATYTVTVYNVDGFSTEGITVMLGSYSAVTDASGVATFTIPEGTYTLSLPNLESFKVYDQTKSLTPSAKDGEVSLQTIPPEGYDILNGEFVKLLSTGSNSVELKSGELTYFLFKPTKSGVYQFKSGYTLSYYGNNLFFIQDQTGTLTDYATTSFSVNIKDSQMGSSFLIGVTAPAGKTSATVTVTRTGNAIVGWEDKDYTPYAGVYTPQSWTFSGGALTYVDITGNAADYQLVLGSDGYYHLNSADGPILYLNLKSGAYPDCALNTMLNSNRPVVQGYVKDENGTILSKENYNDLVKKYVDCSSEGLYRLTADLVRILKTQNENWYTYLSSLDSKINSQIVWMCNICYIP